MQILNIAGYKFIALSDLPQLQNELYELCHRHELKGTILLSREGININLAGTEANLGIFQEILQTRKDFTNMVFHQTYSATIPFKRLKIKLKKEIITLRKPEINATEKRAPSLPPEILKQWLDEQRDLTLLDTRNDYEIQFGTFSGAVNLNLTDFSQFPAAIQSLEKNKPIVMFCTGGIRCEKAALYLLDNGFTDVHQLEGGILGYFAKVGAAHYQGECFIFDERISVDTTLAETSTQQCVNCQGPITSEQAATCLSCVSCI